MNLYVFDRSLQMIGVIDAFTSLIWTTRYFESGDFELYLPASKENVALLQEDYYLAREQDIHGSRLESVMIIRNTFLVTDVDEGDSLAVSGYDLKELLQRRVVWEQTTVSGKVEVAMRRILMENAIAPKLPERVIPGLKLSGVNGFPEKMEKQVTGENLYDFLVATCKTYGLGWKIYVDGTSFLFEMIKGVDRTYNQTDHPPVIFSDEYDNLLSTSYQYHKDAYRNVALVAGEGEGTKRKTQIVGSATGMDRYELFVDARNTSSNDGEIGDTEYQNILRESGVEALADCRKIENFEGEIESGTNFVFGKDYFLGDVVEVVNQYGIHGTPRITGVIESVDINGITTIPVYSTMEEEV